MKPDPERAGDSEGSAARDLDSGRSGDRAALGRALESCRTYLMMVADRELDAALFAKVGRSDVVQETYLEAYRDFGGFAGRTEEDLRAWLRGILRNNVADHARRYRLTGKRRIDREIARSRGGPSDRDAEDLRDPGPSPSGQAMALEWAEALGRALRRLPEPYRRAVVLRSQERRPFAEVGEALGLSSEAARKVWYRAIEQLRAALGPDHGP